MIPYFSEKINVCLCNVLLVFSLVYFVCCLFFPSCPQIAEAGTRGDMSYLDAPDA